MGTLLAACLTACGVNISEVKLPTEMTVKTGETVQAVAEFVAANENIKEEDAQAAAAKLGMEWTTDNIGIASVDEDGTITGVGPGKTMVTIKTKDGKLSASVRVIVEPALESIDAADIETNTAASGTDVVYNLLPAGAKADKVDMAIADTSIATVAGGKLTPVKAGETELTITADGVTKTVKVVVKQAPTVLTAENISVTVGKTAQVSVNTGAENVNVGTTYTYVSSDEGVAKVDESGVVFGAAEGTAVVTVTNELGQSCTLNVEVTKPVTKTKTATKTGTATSASGKTGTATNTNTGSTGSASSSGGSAAPAPEQPATPSAPEQPSAPTVPPTQDPVIPSDPVTDRAGTNIGDTWNPGDSPDPIIVERP